VGWQRKEKRLKPQMSQMNADANGRTDAVFLITFITVHHRLSSLSHDAASSP
jgi:hypothetical protein